MGEYDETAKITWLYHFGFTDSDDFTVYVASFYFTVTTLVTVGYGDITAQNSGERFMAVFLMLIGVVTFSFATGTLSSIITSYDSNEAQVKEKIATLNSIMDEYDLNIELFSRLVRNIKYDHSKKQKDTMQFMDELPHELKLELADAIHRKLYATVIFFQKKEASFIAWITKVIVPLNVHNEEYIYKEGEEIDEIYFLVKGDASYVLPRFDNDPYMDVKTGEHFGHIELGDHACFTDLDT